MVETFGSLGRVRIAIEVGTHSPWVSRLLRNLGHEMIVANPKQVRLITESSRKDDRLDARTLARLARIDPQLLRPIQHRSEEAQGALMIIRVRAALMAARTSLVNTARGLAKSMGERLPKCDADQMGVLKAASLPPKLRQADLKDEPFVLFSRRMGSLAYDRTVACCEEHGFRPNVVQDAPQWATVLQLVAAELGVSLAPDCVRTIATGGVVFAKVRSRHWTSVDMGRKAKLDNPAAEAFLRLARQQFAGFRKQRRGPS